MPRQLRIEYPGAIYHLVNVVTGLALRLRKNFKSICTKSEFALRFCGVTFGRLKASFLFLVMVLCFAAGVSAAGTTNGSHKIKIILIGDSTMTDSAGWGSGFKQFLDPDKVELVNASAGGHATWRIRVQDNGIGFEEKFRERIFEVFQRLHNRSEYEGSGIGLSLCRKIAQRHGGSISAESPPGQGATFLITLPETHAESTGDAEPATTT